MRFLLYLVQEGGGCDYTIGCGTLLHTLKAPYMDAAVKEAIGLINESYRHDSDNRLKTASVLAVTEERDLILNLVYEQQRRSEQKERQEEDEAKERLLYDLLKAKYEAK